MNHVAWRRQAFFPLGAEREREPGDARLRPWTMIMTERVYHNFDAQIRRII